MGDHPIHARSDRGQPGDARLIGEMMAEAETLRPE
jgi:hypothetical protein